MDSILTIKVSYRILFALTTLFMLSVQYSCSSKYQQLLKSNNGEAKLEAAIKYYNKEDYYRSLQLLEGLMNTFRGTSQAEQVYYYYAFCYYGQADYATASYHFRNYFQTFPNTAKSEECLFMSAFCKYMDSPAPTLDQTSTLGAIKELQLFINKYPKSDSLNSCNKLMDELYMKLEKKALEAAKLYFNLKHYNAAIIAYKNLIKEFPATQYKEDALFYIIKANYDYAVNSVAEKQRERFEATLSAYQDLMSDFPETKYTKEATSIFKNTNKELSRFTNKNS